MTGILKIGSAKNKEEDTFTSKYTFFLYYDCTACCSVTHMVKIFSYKFDL